MATLAEFLERLFAEGRVAFREPPSPASEGDRAAAAELLRSAIAEDLMELAGTPVPFVEQAALAAAEWTRLACWFLISRGEPAEIVDRALAMPPAPRSAGEHLAGDLTFRYLPAVHRRARALDAGDVLARRLAETMRRWPLSGVLGDVEDGPTTRPDFDGHDGLLLRYVERLATRERPAWTPTETRGRELLALVLDAEGRRAPPEPERLMIGGADDGRG